MHALTRRSLAAVLGLISVMLAGRLDSATPENDCGVQALEIAIRNTGYAGGLEILRDDSQRLYGSPSLERLVFLKARPGGWIGNGMQAQPYVTNDIREWRALADCVSGRLYDVFGFDSLDLERALKDADFEATADAETAQGIARFFGRNGYRRARSAIVPSSLLELQHYAEDVVYRSSSSEEVAQREVRKWLSRSRSEFKAAIETAGYSSDESGWNVTIPLALRTIEPTRIESEPRIELRLIGCRIAKDGGFKVVSDQLIGSLDTRRHRD